MLDAAHGLPAPQGLDPHAVGELDLVLGPGGADLGAVDRLQQFVVFDLELDRAQPVARRLIGFPDDQGIGPCLGAGTQDQIFLGQGGFAAAAERLDQRLGFGRVQKVQDIVVEIRRGIGMTMDEDGPMRQLGVRMEAGNQGVTQPSPPCGTS